ncbi:hypothetical protein D9M71_511060 [compost metagenome]
MIGAAGVLVVIHDPVDVAVDQQVRVAQWQGVGPGRADLPDIIARARAFGLAVIEVQGKKVETRYRQVETGTDQVGLGVVFAVLVGHGQQHVLDRAEFETAVEDLAEG